MSRVKQSERVHELNGTTFKLDRKYMGLKTIGKGSYGVVVAATDSSCPGGRRVAIKKITPVAAHATDAKHVLREIRLMRYLGGHENIISLHDMILREADDELYIVMELFDSDLHKVIQSPQPLTDAHHKHFMFQLFSGMKYMHDHRIIHRDLKPGNLLVSRDCKLRITDFGLARVRPTGKGEDPDQDIDEPMTEHVVTRWYRPPELMLCPDGLYTYAVDLWSAGCILAELLGRKPLFPGKNFVHQLSLIFDVIGLPPAHETNHIRNTQAKRFLATQVGKRKIPLNRVFPLAPTDAIDMLEELLVFSPDSRATADEMLRHSYLHGVSNPTPVAALRPPNEINFDFETQNFTRHQLQELIVDEIAAFHHNPTRRRSSSSAASTDETGNFSHVPRADHATRAHDYKQLPRPEVPPAVTSASSSRRPSFAERVPTPAQEQVPERPASQVAERKDTAPPPSAKNTAAMERLDSSSAKAMEILSPAHKLTNSESTETIVNNPVPYAANNGPTAPAKATGNNRNRHAAEPAVEKQAAHVHKTGRPPRHSTGGDAKAGHNGTHATAAAAAQPGVASGTRHQPARSRDVTPDRKRSSDISERPSRNTQSSSNLSTVAESKPSGLPRYLTATASSSSRVPGENAPAANASTTSDAPKRRPAANHAAQQQQQPQPERSTTGGRKKHVTVPKSPHFSKMSWQKRGTEGESKRGHGAK